MEESQSNQQSRKDSYYRPRGNRNSYRRNDYRPRNDGPKASEGKQEQVQPENEKIVNNNAEKKEEKAVAPTPAKKNAMNQVPECVICTDPIKCFALGRCNHRQVCSICAIRRRKLYTEYDCPVCRSILDVTILTRDKQKPFEEFDLREMKCHYDGKFFFTLEDSDFEKISKLWDIKCKQCGNKHFSNIEELEKHLENKHHVQFCKLCVEYRKVFLQEQKTYNQNELNLHLTSVDSETRVKHEVCEFCLKPFYDTDSFYHHIQHSCRHGDPNTSYANRDEAIREQIASVNASSNRPILPTTASWGRSNSQRRFDQNFPELGTSSQATPNPSTSPGNAWGSQPSLRNSSETVPSQSSQTNSQNQNTPNMSGNQNQSNSWSRISQQNGRRNNSEPVVLHIGGLPTGRPK